MYNIVQIEQLKFSKIACDFNNKPYNLTNAWIEYLKSENKDILFFVNSLLQPKILCLAIILKRRLLGNTLKIEGLIYKEDVTHKQLYKFMEGLKTLPYKGIYLNPNTEYNTIFEIAARKAMFKRPFGQSSINLTILVYPKESISNRNWKRNLKKANNENLEFKIKTKLSFSECKTIALLHAENANFKNLTYSLKAKQVDILVNHNKNIFACLVYKNKNPLAARIISIDDYVSFDIFACNSLESRKNGSNQYLLQNIFDYLKDHNIEYFDFSRIPIGRKGANGIYEFKKSTGGKVIQYNGEWIYFKIMFFRYFYFFYRVLISKTKFY